MRLCGASLCFLSLDKRSVGAVESLSSSCSSRSSSGSSSSSSRSSSSSSSSSSVGRGLRDEVFRVEECYSVQGLG